MTLSTTGITYGSGTYEIHASTVYSTATQYDPYRMLNFLIGSRKLHIRDRRTLMAQSRNMTGHITALNHRVNNQRKKELAINQNHLSFDDKH